MDITLPPQVRSAIYITVVIGTAIIVPLNASGIVNDVIFAVWTSLAGAASALAAINVNSKGVK